MPIESVPDDAQGKVIIADINFSNHRDCLCLVDQLESQTPPLIRSAQPLGLGAGLDVGMQILQINGVNCLSRDHAVSLMTTKSPNSTTTKIVAASPDIVLVAARKESKDAKVGVVFQHSDEGHGVMVGFIATQSLFANTTLQEGMKILSINGVDCKYKTSHAVTAVIAEAEGIVTIMAEII